MHPIKQLQKLLNPRSPNSGRVIQSSNGNLLVATQKGSQSIQKNSGDANIYKAGDTVALVNGQVVGKRVNQPTVYVL